MIDNWRDALVDVAYLVTAVCFILGLRFLGNPNSARKGNQLAALGMGIAIIATLFSSDMEEGGAINWTNIGLILAATENAAKQLLQTGGIEQAFLDMAGDHPVELVHRYRAALHGLELLHVISTPGCLRNVLR